jgi:hypothetical protein
MKKLSTLFMAFSFAFAANAQTTVYTTGQTYTDDWSGWSVPVTSNANGSINGAYMYIFSSTAAGAYTVEIKRQFTINSSDLDIYLSATSENSTISVLHSTDNMTYTEIGSGIWASGGLSNSTIVVPTFNPGMTTFWLKLKMVGTAPGVASQSIFNNLKIDADLTTSGMEDFKLGSSVIYSGGMLEIKSLMQQYEVQVYDINGQLVVAEQNMKSYDFSAHNSGLYFVTFLYEGKRKTLKIANVN